MSKMMMTKMMKKMAMRTTECLLFICLFVGLRILGNNLCKVVFEGCRVSTADREYYQSYILL